ncbi:MAG: sugar ABC transporter ATP-binding protein [Treponema sp.]
MVKNETDDVILQIKGLSKSFPGVQALKSFDLDICKGQTHAFLGQNGAGKSTLIKLLSGVILPDEGDIYIENKPVFFHSPVDAQKSGIFTIFQELSLVPELSAAENIFISDFPRLRGGIIDWRRLQKEAASVMEWLGFSLDVTQPVRKFSVAQKQGVELAKALHHQAKIILLDEPSAALPEPDVERLFTVLRSLQKQGIAIIYISHRLEEVEELCDIATVLRDGQKVGTYSMSETKRDTLIRAMIGHDLGASLVGNTAAGRKKPQLGGCAADTVVLSVSSLCDGNMLHDISFDLRKGELLGITGLVGNGQSELSSCIFGARKTVSGNISINGKEVRIKTPREAIRMGIGFLPEERKTEGLILPMSIESNITMACHKTISTLSVINRKKERSIVDRLAASLNIKAFSTQQQTGTLSGGNQQKVVLAKWIASQCQILVFAEPTRGIDIGAKEEIYGLIKLFIQKGGSVILISSEMPEAMMCDRVLVMSNGSFAGELKYNDIDPHGEAILNLCCR